MLCSGRNKIDDIWLFFGIKDANLSVNKVRSAKINKKSALISTETMRQNFFLVNGLEDDQRKSGKITRPEKAPK